MLNSIQQRKIRRFQKPKVIIDDIIIVLDDDIVIGRLSSKTPLALTLGLFLFLFANMKCASLVSQQCIVGYL